MDIVGRAPDEGGSAFVVYVQVYQMKKILMVVLVMAFYAHGSRLDLVPRPGSPLPEPELDYERPTIINLGG